MKLSLLFLLICALAHSQTASFNITDIDNIPIKGCLVSSGVLNATTDMNGVCSLALSAGANTISFTHPNFIGVFNSYSFSNDTVMQIKLQPVWVTVIIDVPNGTWKTIVTMNNVSKPLSAGKAKFVMRKGTYKVNAYTSGSDSAIARVIADTIITLNLK